ncbi:hypothetical protein PG985_015076 [Apiospora marii]|uniref:uncharacterized protein n=1 Tax=Apiospora marii TaxID=335849 RepID=UPI0031307448
MYAEETTVGSTRETGQDNTVLPGDIFWAAAHSFLHSPVDVFNLARTCRDHWKLLETEIYRTDVLFHKTCLDKSEPTNAEDWHVIMEEKPYDSDDAEDVEFDLAYWEEHVEITWLRPLSAPKWRPLTALQWAAVAGAEAVAERTITVAERIWPDYIFLKHLDSLNSAIHFAAWYGNTGILKLLSQVRHGGVMPDMTALSGATWSANVPGTVDHQLRDVFRYINPSIAQFPEEFFIHCFRRDFGLDATVIAILRGHAGTAEYLINSFYDNERTVEIAKIANDEDHEQDTDTPLMWAVARPNNVAIIECLLRHGADVALRDKASRDALLWAVLFHAHENALRLVKMGVRLGHDFWRTQIAPDYNGYKACALGLCMEDDAFLPCTKLILQSHPDFPEELLRYCMFHAVSDASKNQATLRWLIGRGVGLVPFKRGN